MRLLSRKDRLLPLARVTPRAPGLGGESVYLVEFAPEDRDGGATIDWATRRKGAVDGRRALVYVGGLHGPVYEEQQSCPHHH
jgi:hypothetical protein